jgi:TRAP-type C4-dicarboxylate transport system, large permease component
VEAASEKKGGAGVTALTAFLLFVILAALTVPVMASLGMVTVVSMIFQQNVWEESSLFTYSLAGFLNSPSLISIPLFVLAGEMAVASGVARRLVAIAGLLAGPSRPALGMAVAAIFFACLSGVGPAAATVVGLAFIPAVLRTGWRREDAASLASATAGLALVIPASMPLTLFAAMAGIHTNHLFTASFIPGLIMGLATILCLYRRGAPTGKNAGGANGNCLTWAQVYEAKWAISLPLLVLAALFTGFLIAPEAAAFSAVYAALIGRFAYRTLSLPRLWQAVRRSAVTASAALAVAAAASMFYNIPALHDAPERFCLFLNDCVGGAGNVTALLVVVCVLTLLGGFFFDVASLVVILAPLFIPLTIFTPLTPVHLGVVMTICLAISLSTPPECKNLEKASAIAEVPVSRSFGAVVPYLLFFLVVLALVVRVPYISQMFPALFGWEK